MSRFLCGMILMLTISCSPMFNSKTVPVQIISHPNGADITIEGNNYGKTPATVQLEPSRDYKVLLTGNGYSKEFMIKRGRSGDTDKRPSAEVARCMADAASVVLAVYTALSVYCANFEQSQYVETLQYNGMYSSNDSYNRNYAY